MATDWQAADWQTAAALARGEARSWKADYLAACAERDEAVEHLRRVTESFENYVNPAIHEARKFLRESGDR